MTWPGFSNQQSTLLLVIALSLLFCNISLPTHAAEIKGIVLDPDGYPVPTVKIVVTGVKPGVSETYTDSNGHFALANLQAGTYRLHVVLHGFTAEPVTVLLDAEDKRDLSLKLQISALSESLVVSAAQTSLPLSEASSTITIISGAELDARQSRTLDNALAFVPGLSIARNGGLNSLTSLFARGGESDFMLVLLDGVRINAFGGSLDLAQIPVVDVDRIEIVRGPQSALFGSDSIGGVIQIVSRQGNQKRIEGLIEGGSQGTIRARAAASGNTSSWSWNLRLEDTRSNGYTGLAASTGQQVSNDDGRAKHLGFGAGWHSSSGAELRGTGQLSWTERGFPGPYGSNPIGAYISVDRISRGINTRRQFGLQWTQPWPAVTNKLRQRTALTLTDFDSTFTSPFGTSDNKSKRTSVRSQIDAVLTNTLDLSTGFEVQRESARSTFITDSNFQQIPVQRWLAGYFGELRVSPTSRLSIAAGVRIEQISRDALASNPSPFAPRPYFNTDTVISVNPKVSLAYLLNRNPSRNQTKLRISTGTGIRPPDAFEIAFTDNPVLKPERSRSLDIGIQQILGDGTGSIDATVFINSYDDLIVTIGNSFRDASQFRTDNISNARSSGFELAIGIRPLTSIDLRTSYTWLSTKIIAIDGTNSEVPPPYKVGEALIRRPRNQGSVSLTYTHQRLSGFFEAVFRGKVRDIEPSLGSFGGAFMAAGYRTMSIGGTIQLTPWAQVLARIENFSNTAYEQAFGFPAPGRTAMVGIRVITSR